MTYNIYEWKNFQVLSEHGVNPSVQQGGDYVYGSMKPESDILTCGNALVQTASTSAMTGAGTTAMSAQHR